MIIIINLFGYNDFIDVVFIKKVFDTYFSVVVVIAKLNLLMIQF